LIARTRRAVGGDQRCSPRTRDIAPSGFMRFSATTFQETLHVAPDVLLLSSTEPTDQPRNKSEDPARPDLPGPLHQSPSPIGSKLNVPSVVIIDERVQDATRRGRS
jgi:hypothetical protein